MSLKINRREFLRLASVGIAGLASSALFAACAPAQPAAAPTAAAPAVAATVAVPAAAPTAAPAAVATVPAVVSGSAVPKVGPISILINTSPWLPGFQKLVQSYQDKTGNKVTLQETPLPGMLEKTRNATTAKESDYDIVNLNEGWYATFYAGKFMTPIQDIEPDFKLDPNIIEYVSSTRWNFSKNYSAPDGTLYGLPINGNIQLLYYRSDLFQQAGLNPPQTWDDIEAAAKKFHKPPDMYGFSQRGQQAGFSCGFDWLAFLRSYKGDWVAKPGEDWTVTINNDAGKQAMARFVNLLKSYGPPNIADIGNPENVQLMATGKLAMSNMVVANFPQFDDPKASKVVNQVAVTVMPKQAGGVNGPTSGIWVMGIPINLPDARKKAGLTFLKWALTKEAQMDYTRFGAIPVRQDVYQSELATQPQFRWMKAMADSTPFIKENIRIPEGPQITDILELRINDVLSGKLTGDAASDTMAKEMFAVLQKAGYKTKMS